MTHWYGLIDLDQAQVDLVSVELLLHYRILFLGLLVGLLLALWKFIEGRSFSPDGKESKGAVIGISKFSKVSEHSDQRSDFYQETGSFYLERPFSIGLRTMSRIHDQSKKDSG